jgi:hypothetical protein
MAIRLNNSYFRVSNGYFRSIEPVISSQGTVLTYTVTELLTTTGAGTWTKPAGVTEITVECIGGGGAGGGGTANPSGGGGGAGGQYARSILTYESAQQSISYTVGAGATGGQGDGLAGSNSTWNTNQVVAVGGDGGTGNATSGEFAPGGVGSTVGGVGDIVYKGGSGFLGQDDFTTAIGGAGGGGAGSTGDGGDAPNFLAGGTGASELGGNGGNGVDTTGAPLIGGTGLDYGGGGGGSATSQATNATGGSGAQGVIRVAYTAPPPLQTYTGSNAAYSIRKLIDTATFSMQVQRSSDNTTLDIGFQPDGMLDTGSITTFVGAGTGYVKRWYDQLGAGYDFEPFNASPTTWPVIVTSGTLETTNGKPAIKFNAGQALIIATADRSYTTGGGLWFQFTVAQSADATTRILTKIGNNTVISQALRRGTTSLETIGYNTVGGTGTDANGVSPGTAQFIAYVQRTTSGIEIYMNGTSNGATSVTGTPQTEASSNMTLGAFNPATLTFPWSGTVQEIIHYPQDSTAFDYRTALTAQINAYYGTF